MTTWTGETRRIGSLESLIAETERAGDGRLLARVRFRGQADCSWPLLPSIGRLNHYSHAGHTVERFNRDDELNFLHRFRRQACEFLGRLLDDWDTLFMARHHGLPVRLLDWTSNPLVALYHCCLHLPPDPPDGAIWVFREVTQPTSYLDIFDHVTPRPLEVNGVRVIHHAYISPRMRAQASLFTIQDDPWRPLETYGLSKGMEGDLEILEKWVVPGHGKRRLLLELDRCGVSARSLFPDLDGLARGLWQTEVLRRIPDAV